MGKPDLQRNGKLREPQHIFARHKRNACPGVPATLCPLRPHPHPRPSSSTLLSAPLSTPVPLSVMDTHTQNYAIATICSISVAVGLNKAIARSAKLSKGVLGRFVPLTAIAAVTKILKRVCPIKSLDNDFQESGQANCINIPMMRQVELREGIAVSTAEGMEIGKSKAAALGAVAQVLDCASPRVSPCCLALLSDLHTIAHTVLVHALVPHTVTRTKVVPSRVLMAVPNMGFTPIIMLGLEQRVPFLFPSLAMPITTLVTGSPPLSRSCSLARLCTRCALVSASLACTHARCPYFDPRALVFLHMLVSWWPDVSTGSCWSSPLPCAAQFSLSKQRSKSKILSRSYKPRSTAVQILLFAIVCFFPIHECITHTHSHVKTC